MNDEKSYREGTVCKYDPLTGVYNLDTFKKGVRAFLKKQKDQSKYALLYTDITHFGRVNNLYGNRMADTLLIDLAQAIKEIDFGLHMYCRNTADHFVILVDFVSKEKLRYELEEFCRAFNGVSLERFQEALPRLGIGVSVIEEMSDSIDDMIEMADQARKNLHGSSTVSMAYFNPVDFGKYRRVKEIEKNMSKALENGEFKVYLQPKYDVMTKRMVGAEALVRWIREDGTMIYPDEFIPLFEKNGFINKLDFYMLEQVCVMLRRRLQEKKVCLPISINQSRVLLNSETYTSDVAMMLSSYDTPPVLIELELTERIFSDSLEEMASMMSELKEIGVRWSIDDFGTGFSSLNLLKKLPVDTIKIDKTFLDETETSEVSRIIIRKTVELIRELDKMVVCEGVETEDQASYLKAIHCDVSQGYLYSEPMPMEEFERLLDAQESIA